jgi:hypothetical protein
VVYFLVYKFYEDKRGDEELLSHPYVVAALISAFMFLLSSKVTFSYNRVSDDEIIIIYCIQLIRFMFR